LLSGSFTHVKVEYRDNYRAKPEWTKQIPVAEVVAMLQQSGVKLEDDPKSYKLQPGVKIPFYFTNDNLDGSGYSNVISDPKAETKPVTYYYEGENAGTTVFRPDQKFRSKHHEGADDELTISGITPSQQISVERGKFDVYDTEAVAWSVSFSERAQRGIGRGIS
jgi:hypothetical protein